jgi:hypothetical protein
VISIDVLADERDLAHPGVGQPLDLGKDFAHRPRDLGAARIGHDTERTELVAAFLHGDKRSDTARAYRLAARRFEQVELVLDRKFGIDHRALMLGSGQQLRQTMVALRAEDEIDGGCPPNDLPPFGLSDTAGDSDGQAASLARRRRLECADAPEFGIHLFCRLLANVAGIEDDKVRVREVGRLGKALGREHVRHTMGIVDVHLAAEGFDVELAGWGHAGRVVLRAR